MRSASTSPPDRTGSSWRRVLGTFAPDWWRERRALAASYGFGFLAVGAAVLTPWPLKFLIDYVLDGSPVPAPFGAFVAELPTGALIVALTCAAALIGIAGATFSALEKMINARVRERMGVALRDRLLGHVQTLPLSFRTTDLSGEIVLRLVNDVFHFVRFAAKTVPTIFRHLATVLVTFAAMFWVEPRLGLLALAIVVLLATVVRRYAQPLRRASQDKRRREGEVAGLVQEIVCGLASTRIQGAETRVRDRFAALNVRSLSAGVRETQVGVAMERAMEIAKAIALALAVGGGGLLVIEGDLTVGGLMVGMAYLSQILQPVAKINELAASVSRGLARGEMLLALLDRASGPADKPGAIAIDRAVGRIELRGVSYVYPPTRQGEPAVPVLKDIDLSLEPGMLTVLVGPSGSGKSTLFSLLLRLFDPSSGDILLDGVRLPDIELRRLRAQFSVMLQETHLFAGTLREALRPVDVEASDGAMWDVLAQVALDDFVRGLPGGLDAHLGENGVNLSGGQRARLSLARALLPDRPILLLDEPLANVDPESQRIILDAIDHLRTGRTCLAVTHQPLLAERADVILRLENQRIISMPVSDGASMPAADGSQAEGNLLELRILDNMNIGF